MKSVNTFSCSVLARVCTALVLAVGTYSTFVYGSAPKDVQPPPAKAENVEGTFVGEFARLGQGQDQNANVRDEDGVEHSFVCSNNCGDLQTREDYLRGKKIKIHWKLEKRFVQEAGESHLVKIITKVEALK